MGFRINLKYKYYNIHVNEKERNFIFIIRIRMKVIYTNIETLNALFIETKLNYIYFGFE